MADRFCTDLVPAEDRLDAWLFQAKQICGDCRFQFPRRPVFHGCIERRSIGGLELTRFSSTPLAFQKFPVVAAGSPERSCVVITQLEGCRTYRQAGALVRLSPGDSTFVDSGAPWSSECAGLCSRLYLRMPLWVMQNRLRRRTLPILPHITGARGVGAAFYRLLTSLYNEADVLSAEEGTAAVAACLEILSACIPRSPNRRANELDKIEEFIELHLADPCLTPATVANAAGVSLRQVYRLFSQRSGTLGDYIRERRLQRCRADMADPRLAHRTITEIALFWGFSDSAHFSHCFKQRFGVSPRGFRVQITSGACGIAQSSLPPWETAARLPRLN